MKVLIRIGKLVPTLLEHGEKGGRDPKEVETKCEDKRPYEGGNINEGLKRLGPLLIKQHQKAAKTTLKPDIQLLYSNVCKNKLCSQTCKVLIACTLSSC